MGYLFYALFKICSTTNVPEGLFIYFFLLKVKE